MNKLRKQIKSKKYFLFGSDSCKIITKYFDKLIDEFEEQKDDFILITGKTLFRPTNASKEFKNKYVFYSPSITTGVSFVLKDLKQNHFIYISKNQLITPISMYQMCCRTRNMKGLHIYIDKQKVQEQKFETLKEVENKYKKMLKVSERIFSISKSINESDEVRIVENTFFKLYCYNIYQDNVFSSGYAQHFFNILKDNGFNISSIGETKKLDKDTQKQINEIYEMVKQNEFDEFLTERFREILTEEDIKSD